MNVVSPPTFRPRTSRSPLCAAELKRSPRFGFAGSNPAALSSESRRGAVLDRTRTDSEALPTHTDRTVAVGDRHMQWRQWARRMRAPWPQGVSGGVPSARSGDGRRVRVAMCRCRRAGIPRDAVDEAGEQLMRHTACELGDLLVVIAMPVQPGALADRGPAPAGGRSACGDRHRAYSGATTVIACARI